MTNQVGPGLAKPAYGSELRARDRNEVRVSGFHRGPQRNYRLQQGRIESCSPSCQSDHAKAVAKRDAFIESRMNREVHVRICEGLAGKFRRATRLWGGGVPLPNKIKWYYIQKELGFGTVGKSRVNNTKTIAYFYVSKQKEIEIIMEIF